MRSPARRLLAAIVVALAGGVSGAPSPAQEGRSAADDVDAVRALVRERKWDEGRAAIGALLEARKADAELRPLLGDVEELLERCLYGLRGAKLDPAVALGPGAVKYVAATRSAVFQTSPEATARWLREPDGTRTLPVPFEGDVSVEMSWSDADDWSVIVGWDPDDGTGWRIEARAQDHSASPGRVVRMTEDGEKVLGAVAAPRSKEPAQVRIARVGATIVVTADRVQLAGEVANGARRAFVALRPAPDGGDAAALPAVRISGRIDPKHARKAAAAADSMGFQWWRVAEYRRSDALPAWVLDLETSSRRWIERTPEVPAAHADAYRDAVRAFFERGPPTVHRRVDELRDVELPAAARSLLDAIHACCDDRVAEAEPALRDLHREHPASAAIAAALGTCLRRSGRGAEAEAAFAAARAADVAYAPAYDDPVAARFEAGELDGAQALLDAAARAGAATERTVELRSHVQRARRGPPWPKRIERDAGPFHVVGDVPRAALDAVAKAMAEAASDFAARVRPLPVGTRLRAWVFSDESAYVDWCRDGHADAEDDASFLPRVAETCVHVGADGVVDLPAVRRAVAESHLAALGARSRWLAAGLPRALAAAPAGGSGFVRRFAPRFEPWPAFFAGDGEPAAGDPDVRRVQSVVAARALLGARDSALRGVLAAYLDATSRGEGPEQAFRTVIEPVLPAFERDVAALR